MSEVHVEEERLGNIYIVPSKRLIFTSLPGFRESDLTVQ